MDGSFELEVMYKGHLNNYPARLVQLGYSYKIFVAIDAYEIIFEPDEERNFRAILPEEFFGVHKTDIDLVKAIGQALEHEFR